MQQTTTPKKENAQTKTKQDPPPKQLQTDQPDTHGC